MQIKHKIVATVLSGLAIAGFVAATALAVPQSSSADTGTPVAATSTTPRDRGARPANNQDKYLADALGITQADLTAARTKAHEAAIQQAVKDGLITQEQADAMLGNTASGGKGGRIDLRGANIDQDALLANALGITVDKLQSAKDAAAKAELAQAVTDGRMTQEQADLAGAQRALQKYISDKGLFESAVQSAVQDGVLTQAQADAILAQDKSRGRGDLLNTGDFGGGRGMGGGKGMGDDTGRRGAEAQTAQQP